MVKHRPPSRSRSTSVTKNYEYQRPWLYDRQRAAIFHDKRYGLIEASTKAGKSQPLDALIYTPTGAIKMGDIALRDTVLTPDGGRASVIGIYPQGERQLFRLTFSDGSQVEADAEHLWQVCEFRRRPKVLTTAEMMAWPESRLRRSWVPLIKPADFHCQPVPIDPYAIGLLLGDGGLTSETVRFSSCDIETAEALAWSMPPEHALWKEMGDNADWRVSAGVSASRLREAGEHFRGMLAELGMIGVYAHEKRIPEIYRYNGEWVRRSVLQGLLDADGFVDKHGQPGIEQTSGLLAKDIEELVQSLGGTVLTRFRKINGYRNKRGNYIACRPVYRQSIRFPDSTWCFRLERKRSRTKPKFKSGNRMFRTIEPSRTAPAQCIEIDHPQHLYLTNGFVPTHNTVGCMAWLLEKSILGKPNQNRWWIAPVYPQAKIAYTRLKHGLPRGVYKANDTELRLSLANGTHIWFKSGEKPDNLYGEDVYDAVIDEASRLREESWHAVRTTMTQTRGSVRLIGNVKGRKNFFYHLCRRAESGDPDMEYHKLTAYDAVAGGVLDLAEVEDAKRTLPEQVFRELYLAEPSDDGGNPFGLSAIAKCVGPLSDTPAACWGWDLAKSHDWTVGIALDAQGRTCRFERWQSPWQETKRRIIDLTGDNPALADSTGVGDPIVEDLQRTHPNIEGFKFSQTSKQQLMEGLAASIQQGDLTYPDGVIRMELEQFEYEYTRTGVRYSAPEGLHDDCVCALALANRKRTQPLVGSNLIAYLEQLNQQRNQ